MKPNPEPACSQLFCRLRELEVPIYKFEDSDIISCFKGDGILVIRTFPKWEGTPWSGPIWQCFYPKHRAGEAFDLLGIG